jgi:glycosyltransferase involved in cell wall biosynthesis
MHSQKKLKNEHLNDTVIARAAGLYKSELYQKAYDLLAPAIERQNIEPLGYVLAAHCLEHLGKIREARYTLACGSLIHPEDTSIKDAINYFIQKVNGSFIHSVFNQTTHPRKAPSISLVLIVKNEEKDLPRCLASFQDIVQEIIVVDTGSTDRTVEIAKSFGARVEYYQWNDDFASARNESLKCATCDWILRTDADEYIEDREKPKLLHAITSGLADVYLCPTYNHWNREELQAINVRLFRNHLGIHYDFPIHETITPSVARLGLKNCITNIRFLHTGYTDNQTNERKRNRRNIQICDRGLQNDPGNYYLNLVKGIFLCPEHPNEGRTLLEKTVFHLPDNALSLAYHATAYRYLGNIYLQQRDQEKITPLIHSILIDCFGDRQMLEFAGELYLYGLTDIEEAYKIFRYAKQLGENAGYMITPGEKNQFDTTHLQNLLIETCILRGDYAQARKYQYSRSRNPKGKKLDDEKLSQIKALSEAGNHEELIRLLGDDCLISPEVQWILVNAFKATGQWQNTSRTIFAGALGNQLNLNDFLELAACQMQLNHPVFARYLVKRGKELQPDSAMADNLDALIDVQVGRNQEAMAKIIRGFIHDMGNLVIKQNLEKIAGLNGLTPTQAMKDIGMKWLAGAEKKDGIMALMIYSRFEPKDLEVKQILHKFLQQG